MARVVRPRALLPDPRALRDSSRLLQVDRLLDLALLVAGGPRSVLHTKTVALCRTFVAHSPDLGLRLAIAPRVATSLSFSRFDGDH